MRKTFFILLLLLAALPAVWAADGDASLFGGPITGTVTDTNGEPIIGAVISVVQNPNAKTVTDTDGRFTLQEQDMPNDAVLHVTCLGYASRDVPLAHGKGQKRL